MARGDNLRQSQLMIQAEESGQAARARAHEGLMAEGRAARQDFQRLGETAGQSAQQHQQFQAQLGEEQHQFDVRDFRQKQQLQLEGAKEGFDMGSEQAPKRGGRAKELEDEMARGEAQTQQGQGGMIGPLETEQQEQLRRQGQKPLEATPQGWRQNELGKQMEERRNYQANTDRMNAEVARANVGIRAQEAAAKGDFETYQKEVDISAKSTNALVDKYDRLARASQGKERMDDEDWAVLSNLVGDNKNDPKLTEAIAKKDLNSPRLRQFLNAKIAISAMTHIAQTGDQDAIKVDWEQPKMKEFLQNRSVFNSLAQGMGNDFSEFARINSTRDKMMFLNQQAALATILGMGQFNRFDANRGGALMGEEAEAAMGGTKFEGFDPGQRKMLPGTGQADQSEEDLSAEEQARARAQMDAEQRRGTEHAHMTEEATNRAIFARRRGENVPPADTEEARIKFGAKNKPGPYHGRFGGY